jgi:hypothetical protein
MGCSIIVIFESGSIKALAKGVCKFKPNFTFDVWLYRFRLLTQLVGLSSLVEQDLLR